MSDPFAQLICFFPRIEKCIQGVISNSFRGIVLETDLALCGHCLHAGITPSHGIKIDAKQSMFDCRAVPLSHKLTLEDLTTGVQFKTGDKRDDALEIKLAASDAERVRQCLTRCGLKAHVETFVQQQLWTSKWPMIIAT